MNFERNEMKLFSGSANVPLAEEIAEYLGMSLGHCDPFRFSDGEVNIKIDETVRGHDVFIIQPTSPPVNENLMELLVMIDAFRRASARTIAAVIPYFGYARQDRKARGRDPITAKLVANLITVAGITRIITLDLHAEQIQGFFDIPVDNLLSVPVFASHFQKNGIYHTDELVVVSPDIGGVKRASRFAEKLGLPLAIMDKRRPKDNIAEVVRLIGDVADKTALVFDDIIDTGRSLAEAAKLIREKGAKRIIACSTHGVFSGDAVELIQNTPEIEAVMATNSIQQKTLPEKFQIISVAKLLGEAIMRVRKNLSVSILFR